jgi:hypothetical protein
MVGREVSTPSLVNGEVHDERARPHGGDHLARDQDGSARAGYQHRAHQHIGKADDFADIQRMTDHRGQTACKHLVKMLEFRQAPVEDNHPRTGPKECTGSMSAQISGTQDHDIGRRHAGHTLQQYAFTAPIILQ